MLAHPTALCEWMQHSTQRSMIAPRAYYTLLLVFWQGGMGFVFALIFQSGVELKKLDTALYVSGGPPGRAMRTSALGRPAGNYKKGENKV